MTDNPYAATTSNPFSNDGQQPAKPMTVSEILFSYEGRISRSTFWGATLGLLFFGMIAIFAVALLGVAVLGEENPITFILIMIGYVPLVYS